MRRCDDCPSFVVDTVDNILTHEITVVQWEAQLQKVCNKKTGAEVEKCVYALYSHTLSLQSAVDRLMDMIDGLTTHIFVAHNQWNCHTIFRQNLNLQSVITVE